MPAVYCDCWTLQSGLMVCGMDAYHEGKQKSNSVVGFVASINEACTRWYSRVAVQQRGEELGNSLKPCFIAALRQYHEVREYISVIINMFDCMCVIVWIEHSAYVICLQLMIMKLRLILCPVIWSLVAD